MSLLDTPTDPNPAGTAPSTAMASSFGQYHVYDAPDGDAPGGPTHQSGVMPGHGHEPLRTPFGGTGAPGAGRERNVTNLDLAANRHPDGFPFAAEDGRGTQQVPVMHREQPRADS